MIIDRELKARIIQWLKDFKATQPHNVSIDTDTFEGEAFLIFNELLSK